MLTFPNIDPVLIAIGPLKIHWYGLMYVLGFVGFIVIGKRRAKKKQTVLSESQVDDLMFWGALGVIAGGRLGYMLFYNFSDLLSNPVSLFFITEGGMSFHGGLLGVIAAMFYLSRRWGLTFFTVADFTAPLIPIGLGLGRIGNFINGELWGRTTDVPWGMVFPHGGDLARHPSQLYQAFLEGLVLFLLLYWWTAKPRKAGAVSGLFLVAYGFFRILAEFFREPDAHLGYIALGWVTQGQLLSLPMILFGAFLLWRAQVSPKKAIYVR